MPAPGRRSPATLPDLLPHAAEDAPGQHAHRATRPGRASGDLPLTHGLAGLPGALAHRDAVEAAGGVGRPAAPARPRGPRRRAQGTGRPSAGPSRVAMSVRICV